MLSLSCAGKKTDQVAEGDADRGTPVWHFEPIDHRQGDMTLTDVWGRSDGAIFIVGWYGTIFTNRVTVANPDGLWVKMDAHTIEHLTAIWGVENGSRFHQHNVDGEMFAVGWNGTLLHYHPNPTMKQDPTPEDGVWQVIAGPGAEFVPKAKVDPKCPDFDGDGIPDDGGGATSGTGGDGWWSPDQTCKSGATSACDDNCRTTANGPQRPIRDISGPNGHPDGCLNPADGDGPYPSSGADTRNQVDQDGDGIGRDCDADDSVADTRTPFRPTLFDVWASANNGQLVVAAVGENGAVITYIGPDPSTPPVAPARAITDPKAWIAQEALSYRYDNDCPIDTVGSSCDAPRLPPACPALCHPFRTPCTCPLNQGQCCVASAPSGAACGDGTCPAVSSACDAATGKCSTNCPGCFRRLDKTLRSVTSDGTNVIAVGASGTIVKLLFDSGTPSTLTETWTRPDCPPDTLPPDQYFPLDERPLLAAIAQRDGVFQMVGAGGTYATIDPTAATCGVPMLSNDAKAPPAFLTSIYPLNGSHAYAVGDSGIFIELNGRGECTPHGNSPVAVISTELPQNINALWVTHTNGVERIWFVGATGTVVRAGCYP